MSVILIALAAFGGSIVAGYGGWLASSEKWDWRKFGTTALTGLGAAIGAALIYDQPEQVSVRDLLFLFLSGLGVNTARVFGANMLALRAKNKLGV